MMREPRVLSLMRRDILQEHWQILHEKRRYPTPVSLLGTATGPKDATSRMGSWHYGAGVDLASNRNEYQESSWG
jgi:hypothetical protein